MDTYFCLMSEILKIQSYLDGKARELSTNTPILEERHGVVKKSVRAEYTLHRNVTSPLDATIISLKTQYSFFVLKKWQFG